MEFEELYGEALDTELGSADRTERFTTFRRKRAINLGQREFARLTDCFPREAQIDLVSDLREYDLEAVINDEAFLRFTEQQPYLHLTDAGGHLRSITGEEFPRRDIAQLDRETPGWRSNSSGSTPCEWYLREEGGRTFFGLNPMPSIPSGATWLAFVPYSSYPADMILDDDEPFQTDSGGNPKTSLRIYHQAIVHRAAAELEKLRRNYPQMKEQLRLFGGMVQDYREKKVPTGGQRVSFARNYAQEAMGRTRRNSPPYGY